MRSIEKRTITIKGGKTVLGFGFMDQGGLGKRLIGEFIRKYGKQEEGHEVSVQKTVQQEATASGKGETK